MAPPSALKTPIENLIAFRGEVELLQASWALDSGRTVEFRLIERPGADRVNPFKQYTRRRNGHAGQLFYASMALVGAESTMYMDDVMLAGWGDSHDKGQWVKFWLDEEAERHPFAGLTRKTTASLGQMLIIALVLLDDEGKPIDPSVERTVEEASRPKSRSLSSQVHLMITGHLFVQYMREKSVWAQKYVAAGNQLTPEVARQHVKAVLKIESLSDLDRFPDKAAQFHKDIRIPFSRWSGQE